MKTFLLIGGAGYIGSVFAYYLLDNNYKVIIIDNLSSGNKEFLDQNMIFYNIDHNNIDEMEKVFVNHQIDTVVMFSAFIKVGESVTKPLDYYRNNINGIINVLTLMDKFSINKLLFSSTAAVYGKGKGLPFKENNAKKPINPYGNSKVFCEQIIKDYAKTNEKFKYGILRYFNVAGSDSQIRAGLFSKTNNYSLLIPVIANKVLKEEEFEIFGNDYNTPDGTCIRDYIHVKDLAEAHLLLDKYLDKHKSEIFNVGSNKGYSNKEVVDMFSKILNRKINFKFGARREGDPDFLVSDSNKIQQKLRFKLKYSLEDMINHEIQWRKKLKNLK
ncbi:UDP-glucose 4-epimerase GalE [Mycoplasma sp. Z386]